MLVDSFVIGIIVSMFRGGKFKDLLQVKLKGLWLIVLAFFIQYATIWIYPNFLIVAVLISYSLLLFFAFLNRNQPGFTWVISGIAMNLLVMMANGGRMPVDMQTISQVLPQDVALLTAGTGKHIAMSDHTYLNFLGDIFYLHAPYPRNALVSLGDIVFSIGVFIWIQRVTVMRRPPIQGSVVHGSK